ncbi:hypothetical protein EYF80_008956 [Liparis tanakae]|uniref:Uncharacterized protein n=1 Tax=Liparis tanakae TaxID=230148 RepID=A0A4Z2ITT6_9TELE|nr:hypothetical protein EYF80_008956 [Liparis tanakae]
MNEFWKSRRRLEKNGEPKNAFMSSRHQHNTTVSPVMDDTVVESPPAEDSMLNPVRRTLKPRPYRYTEL